MIKMKNIMKKMKKMSGGVHSKSESNYNDNDDYDYHDDNDNGVLMHGLGRCCYLDGSIYEGEFVNDMKHGTGVFRWPKNIIDDNGRNDSSSSRKISSNSVIFNTFKGRFMYDQMVKEASQPFFEIDRNLNDSDRGVSAFKD